MLDIKKQVDIRDGKTILASCYNRSYRTEYIVIALSDDRILIHTRMIFKDEKNAKLIPWLKNHRPCCMRFSGLG